VINQGIKTNLDIWPLEQRRLSGDNHITFCQMLNYLSAPVCPPEFSDPLRARRAYRPYHAALNFYKDCTLSPLKASTLILLLPLGPLNTLCHLFLYLDPPSYALCYFRRSLRLAEASIPELSFGGPTSLWPTDYGPLDRRSCIGGNTSTGMASREDVSHNVPFGIRY
jgi:hypothetical protein